MTQKRVAQTWGQVHRLFAHRQTPMTKIDLIEAFASHFPKKEQNRARGLAAYELHLYSVCDMAGCNTKHKLKAAY